VLLALNRDDERRIRAKYPQRKVFIVPHIDAGKLADDKTPNWMTGVLSASQDEAVFRIAKTSFDSSKQKPCRAIAFYLPQYHPIPENDEWWGEGFTEWRNVSKAKPLFSGHYQPHVPADLGYYDLLQEETRIAQAELARKYGIEGFCYYHYWFKGKRLLERPMQELIDSGKPDFPFCICWANESWTRRWDGKEQDILMKQEYCEDDDREHIQYLLPLFRDKRYIRVNGKPLFLVYRTENFPNPARTAETWREEARKAGVGELYLCRIESFEKNDPGEIGFDAGLEFAPDWWNKGPQLDAGSELLSQADSDLKDVCNNNYIHTYEGLADAMMAKEVPEYKWLRCVTPSWDNWARRNEGASVFLDSTPEKYREWLARVVDYTNERFLGEERLVFINAWNEWAEGNHLEPDQRFGHAYLEATKEALEEGEIAADVRSMTAYDEKWINSLMGQLAQKERQLSSFRCQLKELEEKKQELLESTSWQVTIPLRWIRQQIIDFKKSLEKTTG
jgi:hypothetical protein